MRWQGEGAVTSEFVARELHLFLSGAAKVLLFYIFIFLQNVIVEKMRAKSVCIFFSYLMQDKSKTIKKFESIKNLVMF